MIGVRLPSRVVRTDIARCLIVASALAAAATAGWGHFGIQGAAKSKSAKPTEDPFLTDDTEPPAADEIPAIPEVESSVPKQPPKKPTRSRGTTESPPAAKSIELPPDIDLTLPDEPSIEKTSKPDPVPLDESVPVLKVPR